MSAVILAVIVVMWAVVLVPMWLRRHDAAQESRSVDRFSTAMRVLSRRNSPDRRYVLMPRRERVADVHVSGAAATRRPAPRPATAAPPARPKRRASLAARRRRLLLGLAGLTALTFVLMLAGVVSWPFQFVVDLVLVAFVVHLRNQAKRTAAAARQRRRPAVAPGAPAVPAPSPRRAPVPPVPAYASAPAAPASYDEQVTQAAVAATGTEDGSGSDAWDPVPVPPPTYTMKPKAPPRRTWTPAGAEATDEPAAAAPQPGADTDELEGILEHRWAVND
ncbi:MAG TPA: hypothetical protein VFH54_14135 [Mycobacteriales bacterium]|nr:hypothetical protein [Mycobacteriales bacterium]